MVDEFFAHGISRVDLLGGMVRIEFFSLTPPDKDEEQAQAIPTRAVLIPVDGFLRGLATQDGLTQQLVKAGLIQRRDDSAAPASAPGVSPNFS